MVDLVRDLAVDPDEPPGTENPLRQVIVNTHSPYFVQYQNAGDLLVALPVSANRRGEVVTTVRLIPLADSWRAKTAKSTVSRADIIEYLREPPGAQLSFHLPEIRGNA
jgi:hypothetical protein